MGSGIKDRIFSSTALATTATSFSVPGGVLSDGGHYAFEVDLHDFQNTGATFFLANQSGTFTTAYSVVEPSSLVMLGSGIVALFALRARRRR